MERKGRKVKEEKEKEGKRTEGRKGKEERGKEGKRTEGTTSIVRNEIEKE